MNRRQMMLGGGAMLSVAVAVLMIVPTSRLYVLAVARQEAKPEGKYVSEWLQELKSEDEETRRIALKVLSSLPPDDARPAHEELARVMLEDPERRVRFNAAFALYKTVDRGSTNMVPALIQALDDTEPFVRFDAAMALQRIGPGAAPAVDALIEAVKRPENEQHLPMFTLSIREQMVCTLGKIGPDARAAVPVLKQLAQDERPNTRRFAIRALGDIGPDAKDAVPVLTEALKDQLKELQESARDAISKIDPQAAEKLESK